ncbi:MAG: lipopolysaccharide heptosyltransferase II [Candidatus Cloacimonetes bacterium]|nr:lipopolysaccharide heptosyltransferase II [Candidatus Cloacimonadota bacterium]
MQRILIVQTAFLGDVILITPLIRATKSLYPEALIDALVIPAAAPLLQNNPHLNDILSFPKRQNPLFAFLKMRKELRNRRYDMVISPHSSARTHLLLYLAGIPLRVGFDRGSLPFLLNKKTPHPRGIHKINKNLSLLKLLSPQEFEMQTELFPSPQHYQKAEELLQPLKGKKLLAMAPGSVWATKCWSQEYYARLAQLLIEQGFGIVLIGGKDDQDKCAYIANELPPDSAINLAGSCSLLESAAAINQCQAMICNDSGTLHLANAMQTKVFAFFGPTVQRIGYYPFREGDIVFEQDLDCRPCSSHGPQKCPLKHHNCMRQTLPEAAFKRIIQELTKE